MMLCFIFVLHERIAVKKSYTSKWWCVWKSALRSLLLWELRASEKRQSTRRNVIAMCKCEMNVYVRGQIAKFIRLNCAFALYVKSSRQTRIIKTINKSTKQPNKKAHLQWNITDWFVVECWLSNLSKKYRRIKNRKSFRLSMVWRGNT